MTTMTINLSATQRFTRVARAHGQSMLRAVRQLWSNANAPFNLTAEERANAYVARMPIALIAS
ncbi:hypothetical protein F0Q45_16110 [Mycobacterium simiae]|uniref:Uncharacterized protein n=1 Tax=Mycobacterium simiae TaxID=1784 RepID=A0A5B1BPX1_MYCSI|nr:hypothetical protein [Mycobacterium simiae]KAA1249254.1 hypothetical protein F0Q45_16110 [Mycobacterium simiae]